MYHLTFDPEAGAPGDKLWGLPRDVSTFALYLNNDLIAEAGADDPRALAAAGEWDWAAFQDVAHEGDRARRRQQGLRHERLVGQLRGVHERRRRRLLQRGPHRVRPRHARSRSPASTQVRRHLRGAGLAVPFGEDGEPPWKAGTVGMFTNGRWATPGARADASRSTGTSSNSRPDPVARRATGCSGAPTSSTPTPSIPQEAWAARPGPDACADTQSARSAQLGANIPSRHERRGHRRVPRATPRPRTTRRSSTRLQDTPTAEGPLWAGDWPAFDTAMNDACHRGHQRHPHRSTTTQSKICSGDGRGLRQLTSRRSDHRRVVHRLDGRWHISNDRRRWCAVHVTLAPPVSDDERGGGDHGDDRRSSHAPSTSTSTLEPTQPTSTRRRGLCVSSPVWHVAGRQQPSAAMMLLARAAVAIEELPATIGVFAPALRRHRGVRCPRRRRRTASRNRRQHASHGLARRSATSTFVVAAGGRVAPARRHSRPSARSARACSRAVVPFLVVAVGAPLGARRRPDRGDRQPRRARAPGRAPASRPGTGSWPAAGRSGSSSPPTRAGCSQRIAERSVHPAAHDRDRSRSRSAPFARHDGSCGRRDDRAALRHDGERRAHA
jgi:hypothetical protein